MTYTRRQWATDFLHAIGNPAPTEPVIDFVAGWTAMETSAGGGASYNLLNTEQRASGSWNFNSAGVQNYPSYTEGVQTNAHVLENGLYNPLLQALETNDATALGLAGQPPSYGVQRSLTNWVKGPGYSQIDASYVNGVVSLAHSASVPGQTFPGSPGSVPTSSSSGAGGFAPQISPISPNNSGSATTTTTSSSGSDPFGIGAAEQSLVSTAAKIFQATLLVLLALALIAIGLFLLVGPAASSAASKIELVNSGESGESTGKALNPKQPKPKAAPKTSKPKPAKAPKPKPAPKTVKLKPAAKTRKLPRASLMPGPQATPAPAAGGAAPAAGGAAPAAAVVP